jgi:hypothetical protein
MFLNKLTMLKVTIKRNTKNIQLHIDPFRIAKKLTVGNSFIKNKDKTQIKPWGKK